MPDFTDSDDAKRKADKPQILLDLSDCGIRDGLNERQQMKLKDLRIAVAMALQEKRGVPAMEARAALLEFYQSLSVIKNGDNVLTPEQAATNDFVRLQTGAKIYDPSYKHPDYWRLP